MAKNGINPYKNPRSRRKLKAKARHLAEEVCKLDLSTKITDKSDWFLQMERDKPRTRTESTKFRKAKKLKPRNTAGGKQKHVRASMPLI